MRFTKFTLTACALGAAIAIGLTGCGGDSRSVYVMGDSLSDVGTFGLKFTVQDATNPKGFPIWTQLVANQYGVYGAGQCNFYSYTGSTFAANSQAGCTNYAIGGGRIVVSASSGGSANPLTIGTQMAQRAQAGGYGSRDLVLVDGGGNDAADLGGAYLGAASGASGVANFQAFLLQQLDGATLQALLGQDPSGALAAGAYMQKLADTFHGQIKTHLLDKGAARVVVLNIPDITLTPRFRAVLAGVTAQAGAPQAALLQGGIRQWIGAFNARLASVVGSDSRIAVVDFYGDFSKQVATPASYGLTNATDTACPVKGVGSDGLPTYDFPTCTSAALDAQSGKTAGWWKTYAFSDGFHPTPAGHQLMADSVNRALAKAGWQ
ncbi:MAG: SGNH/GDSL hydrolase family protein [Limnohabitans sp.]